ncbi:hypothetical protein LLG95_14505 [bacterium]|nr:hypothetical protein [bacterium]
MRLRPSAVYCLMLMIVLGAACKHATGQNQPAGATTVQKTAAPPLVKARYDIGRNEVQFEIELLALPSAAYQKMSFDLRKKIELGKPVTQDVVDLFESHPLAKTLMSPRCKVKYGDFGGYMSEVYYPEGASGRAMPGELELTTVAIDLLPLNQASGIKLYSVFNLVSRGQLANVHVASQRTVHSAKDAYEIYRMKSRDGAWDYFAFVKILTRSEQ